MAAKWFEGSKISLKEATMRHKSRSDAATSDLPLPIRNDPVNLKACFFFLLVSLFIATFL